MKTLLSRRFVAAIIDLGIIILYALILFGIAIIFNWERTYSPISGQLISFSTLTLPVFLYSFLTEKSRLKGTIGKKIQKLIVKNKGRGFSAILLRNILKYLPWEIAHTGIHWVVYYSINNEDPPIWVYGCLILPQIIVIFYVISILNNKGRTSIYDSIARTEVKYCPYRLH